jgi:hypothetical protein|tara:strand:+ start:550 stop:816 length:267 start_codon:yes stop_codon:yes gene_type:complete
MSDIDIGKEFKKATKENPLFLKYFSNLELMLEWYHAFYEESKTRNKSHHEYLAVTIARRQGVSIENLIKETKAIMDILENAEDEGSIK